MDDVTVERVLRTVEVIPPGRVATYGQIGEVCSLGARLVGRIMSQWGSSTPWWRVIDARGRLPAHLLPRAREHWDLEGITSVAGGAGCRLRQHRADTVQLRADAERAWEGLPAHPDR
jgi:methylated-DNA-protein-cysteine methyltransferase-like protein